MPPSSYAATGLNFLNDDASRRARDVTPSAQGELEIVSLLEINLHESTLTAERVGRGYAWLDTGTHGSLLDTGNFQRTLARCQGLQSGGPEEIACNRG